MLHLFGTGTAYYEAAIVEDRKTTTITAIVESHWFSRHGAPRYASGDDEFDADTRKRLGIFFESRGILFKSRPVRRQYKIGIIERKHGTLRRIIERLQFYKITIDDNTLLSNATFLFNCLPGSHDLSSFKLARGYSPSVLGTPHNFVSPDILQGHIEQQATRALQRTLNSRYPSTIPPPQRKPGDPIFFTTGHRSTQIQTS